MLVPDVATVVVVLVMMAVVQLLSVHEVLVKLLVAFVEVELTETVLVAMVVFEVDDTVLVVESRLVDVELE